MTQKPFTAFPDQGLQFLRSLKRHNNREWFQRHKSIYEQYVKQPMTDLITALAQEFQQFAPEMLASPRTSAYRDRNTSELQSPCNLVCRLLLEKKKNITTHSYAHRYIYKVNQKIL